jgi:hypothetical protein
MPVGVLADAHNQNCMQCHAVSSLHGLAPSSQHASSTIGAATTDNQSILQQMALGWWALPAQHKSGGMQDVQCFAA